MSKAATKPYLVNAWTDFAFVGGLSLVTMAVMAWSFGPTALATAAMVSVYLSWVINWPHFSATNYRLFKRRSNLSEYPLTAFFIPVLIFGAVVASFLEPAVVAPYFIKLFLIWSPYHFSGQNVGLSYLYARRAGFEWKSWEKRALVLFIFSTYLGPTLRGELGTTQAEYYQVFYPTFNAPAWMATTAWGLMYVSGALLVFAIGQRLLHRQRMFPAIVLLPAVTQFSWFVVGWRFPSFYYFVPMFHSLQYLLVAWAMEMSERKAEGKSDASKVEATFVWAGINIAGGVILFAGLPRIAEASGIPLMFATGILIAGVQIHHFIVDGVIWKLRNPKVAAALTQMGGVPPRRKAA